MFHTLTRAELHALVWDRPMTRLAAEYSLSDVALHKICRKHDIPTPPVGYRAKKAHGKPVKVTPLPRPDESGSITVREGEASAEGVAVAEAHTDVSAALADWQPVEPPTTTNAIVERTVARLEAAKAKWTGLVTIEGAGLVSVAVRPDCVERAARILRLLADAAERTGIGLDATRRPAVWQHEGEDVSFSFEEVADRAEHEPTEKELRAVERWEAERQATYKRFGCDASLLVVPIPALACFFFEIAGYLTQPARVATRINDCQFPCRTVGLRAGETTPSLPDQPPAAGPPRYQLA